MIKLLGALFILFAGVMIGRIQANRLRDRPIQIGRFVRLLTQLETEISYGFTPLPNALIKLGKQSAEPHASFLTEAGNQLMQGDQAVMDVWRLSLQWIWPQTAMRAGEKEILLGLGLTLGATDREDQIKHLRLAAKQLEVMEFEAAEDRRKFEKMWKSLGLLGGALLAVIMY
jgi:stage III sporulation protein AB